ncbi:hypothetical protein [Leucobacter sp. M11]|uniref:hypothetical protein n=1 Tax=Leucobacter sp. M11 TaxID=2993565 RepID=UPI002D800203|nr:hypothetical protein [Leucobacter sp. M11]MEB4614022.1 hypothetical protein [Leucobacter sp. M11]
MHRIVRAIRDDDGPALVETCRAVDMRALVIAFGVELIHMEQQLVRARRVAVEARLPPVKYRQGQINPAGMSQDRAMQIAMASAERKTG